MKRHPANKNQIKASNPLVSTWLSANAGAGKTKVLSDRVALLLLEGVSPDKILCLTYTKAAATEMQNRLFELLGDWAMRDIEFLKQKVMEIGPNLELTDKKLKYARTLFARAIEAPGGLKIQTIHSFCSNLLKRFPLEAGVSPEFKEIDERETLILCKETIEKIADSNQYTVIEALAKYIGESYPETLIKSLITNRHKFDYTMTKKDLWESFNLPVDLNEDRLVSNYLHQKDLDLVRDLIPLLEKGSTQDQKNAKMLSGKLDLSLTTLRQFQNTFLGKTNSGRAKIGKFPTKSLQIGSCAKFMPKLEALMLSIENSFEPTKALEAAEKSFSLYKFCQIFMPEYERQKQLRGVLDFDDLIIKARDLLSKENSSEWVLYRLDGGINHILIDEAQDTSPIQWEVISLIAGEITSGFGSRPDVNRTIFVVGDKKQSIYSFQGADANEFEKMRLFFSDQMTQNSNSLANQILEYSFRSSEAILKVVDKTFENKVEAGFSTGQTHKAFKSKMPGRVDLWPVIENNEVKNVDQWFQPVDVPAKDSHTTELANQIAILIKKTLENKESIPKEIEKTGRYGHRTIVPGDFLILVQKRSSLFDAIIRSCKKLKLPIAGSDRLKINAEMAVRDLKSLLSFLTTPKDDLSLAIILKSPIFSWTEQQLFTLSHSRGDKSLWEAMEQNSRENVCEINTLKNLLSDANALRPYDLIERILTKYLVKNKLLSRLGNEAEDGIEALLSLALQYEKTEIPSLTGFLNWLNAEEIDIKRQINSRDNHIRIMTVHGAKGLESPIVILPDTAKQRRNTSNEILIKHSKIFWNQKAKNSPKIIQNMLDQLKISDERERERLLYVAMTRAETWLIVAAAGDTKGSPPSWYENVKAGLQRLNAKEFKFNVGFGLRFSYCDWVDENRKKPIQVSTEEFIFPDWLKRKSRQLPFKQNILNPSELEGNKALHGEYEQNQEQAKCRGTLIHLLLEKLQPIAEKDRQEMGRIILEKTGYVNDEKDIDQIIKEVVFILENPNFSDIFRGNNLSEVKISAKLPELENRFVTGIIDKLIIEEDQIRIIEYKSNKIIPRTQDEIPLGMLRQLGAYCSAIRQIYPIQRVRPFILWTAGPKKMELDYNLAVNSLKDIT